MMNKILLLALVALSGVSAGCGDLSEEDLLFKAGVPAKGQLELQPAGEASTADSGQALDAACGQDDLRCNTRDLARGFNGLTFGLLDLIDRISNFPPTTRSKGVRIWGPYFDILKDTTGRFEISRNQDGKSFSFCLHSVHGRIKDSEARDITCDTDVDADTGLAKILSGTFTPGDLTGEAARKGSGHLQLETARIPDFAALHAQDIKIDFDNTDGRHIQLTVDDVVGADGSVLKNPLTYTFDRNADQSGDLSFVIISPDVLKDVPGVETMTVDLLWHADQGGRAIAKIETEGGASFTKDQCWDRHVGTVYVDVLGPGPNAQPQSTGDVGQCLFSCDDFGALDQTAVSACKADP